MPDDEHGAADPGRPARHDHLGGKPLDVGLIGAQKSEIVRHFAAKDAGVEDGAMVGFDSDFAVGADNVGVGDDATLSNNQSRADSGARTNSNDRAAICFIQHTDGTIVWSLDDHVNAIRAAMRIRAHKGWTDCVL